ncbi:MAG TPA: phospholipase D-like domain-containing protein [Sedimentisphaerales bacterium]|nr:phospholipase D-like domain-containing protein [Sedimentisphaerales bacterium]
MEILIADNENLKLIDVLHSSFNNVTELKFSVAFLKSSGLDLIKSDLKNILKNKAQVEFLVGLDFRTTDPNSLFELKSLQKSYDNLRFFCFSEPNKHPFHIFHPKLYLIKNKTGQFTSIVGSSNLTRGGLTDNVELNIIFKGKSTESEILQLVNFYLRMRLRESVFEPSMEYIEGYQSVYKTVLTQHDTALKKRETKKEIQKLKEIEEILPGTRPTTRRLIVDAMKQLSKTTEGYVELQDIYKYVKSQLRENGVYFSDVVDINANIRHAIYDDMVGWKGKYNRGYFEKKYAYSGLFRLTKAGLDFKGR